MSWKQLVGAGTWLGAAVAAGVLLAGLGVGSLMLLRGVIPENGMRTVVGVVSALACFCGGRVAARKGNGGALPRALAVSACVYGAMWLAGVIGVKRRKKKPAVRPHRKGAERRKRAVT